MVKRVWRNGKPLWSSTIGQYNLIALCLRDKDTLMRRFMRRVKVRDIWDNMRVSTTIPLPDLLEEMMFMEAKRRAQNVHIYKVLVEARTYRGSKALERHDQLQALEWSMKKEFDECVILWHVATDICFFHTDADRDDCKRQRFVSWTVSNYMVYLLTQQPSMMQLGYGKSRFEATCAAVKKIFKAEQPRRLAEQTARQVLLEKTEHSGSNGNSYSLEEGEEDEGGASLLLDGCRLAKEMQKLDGRIRWRVMSETWMEMLGYAAIHCGWYQHARALSRGGEFITHFWLLMAQMGVVEEHKVRQFQSDSS